MFNFISTVVAGLVLFGMFTGGVSTLGVLGISNAVDKTLPQEHDHIVLVGEGTDNQRVCNTNTGDCIKY